MKFFPLKTFISAFFVITIFQLSACGGGGGSGGGTVTNSRTTNSMATNSNAVSSAVTTSASLVSSSISSSAQINSSSLAASLSSAQNSSLNNSSAAPITSIPSGGIKTITGDYSINPSFWAGDGPVGSYSIVNVDHPDFSKAARVVVSNPNGVSWNGQLSFPITRAIAKNDVILIHVWFRKVASADESGASFAQLYLESAAPDYTQYANIEISSTGDWQEYFIPVKMPEAGIVGKLDLKIGFGGGNKTQTFDVGFAEILNFEKQLTTADLPVTQITYDGRAPDAAWRAEANARIEQYRKGDFEITLKNADTSLLTNAQVEVKFKKHAYHFGSVIVSNILMGTSTNSQQYRDKVVELFNQSGTENDLKWAPWIGEWGSNFNQQTTKDALQWLRDRGFYLRGHVLVWPSRRNLPDLIKPYIPEDDPSSADPAVKQLVLDHIDDITSSTKDLLDEWDVLNEPFDNHDLMDAFGNSVMTDWYNRARFNLPTHKLFINDYSILSAGGHDIAHQDHYKEIIHYLLDNNAPLDGFGLQSHFSAQPTSITKIYSIIDNFHTEFPTLNIRSTEFDIKTTDENLQADFTRDFLTIFFSHPSTVGVQMWGFWAGAHWIPEGAMYDANWREKPNATAWKDLIYKTWWNNFSGTTDDAGKFSRRGFYGDYQIEVTKYGQVQTFDFSVSKDGTNQFEFTLQ